MSHIDQVKQAREKFLQALADYGIAEDSPINESIPIRDGHYIGRRFSCGNLESMWLADSEELMFDMMEPNPVAKDLAESEAELRTAA